MFHVHDVLQVMKESNTGSLSQYAPGEFDQLFNTYERVTHESQDSRLFQGHPSPLSQ